MRIRQRIHRNSSVQPTHKTSSIARKPQSISQQQKPINRIDNEKNLAEIRQKRLTMERGGGNNLLANVSFSHPGVEMGGIQTKPILGMDNPYFLFGDDYAADPANIPIGGSAADKEESAPKLSEEGEKIKADLEVLKLTTAEKERENKSQALIKYAREQLQTYPAQIQAYKQQATPSEEEKLKVIGKLVVESAKLEFLLGTIYYQGSDQSWEERTNQGHLVDYYKKKIGAKSSSFKKAPWCAMFVGAIRRQVLGSDKGQWGSGYKIANKFDYDGEGAKFVGAKSSRTKQSKNPWYNLKTDLKEAPDQTAKEDLVREFYQDYIHPQPGDIMIVRRVNKADTNSFTKGKKVKVKDKDGEDVIDEKTGEAKTKVKGRNLSHTTLIEKVDGFKLHTIEGNKGAKVTGRIFDLTDPNDLEEIVFISRMSLDNLKTKDKPKSKPKEEEDSSSVAEVENIEEASLLEPIQEMNRLLQDYAVAKEYIKDVQNGSVANLTKSSGGGDS